VNAESVTVNRTICPVCGKGVLASRVITERFEYGEGEDKVSVVAENVPVQVCTHCQETFSGPEAARIRHQAICRALGLLTPDEIRGIRERLGLSQTQFAELTDIGEATISRWERGRLLQNKAMDRYLRLLDRNPGNVRVLEELRNRRNPMAAPLAMAAPSSECRERFWQSFLKSEWRDCNLHHVREKHYGHRIKFPVSPDSFLLARVTIDRQRPSVDFVVDGTHARERFERLRGHRGAVEDAIGAGQLKWDGDKDGRIRSWIRLQYRHDMDLNDTAQWPQLQEWLWRYLTRFHDVFAPRLRELGEE
jgi:putative zinc finger/helix-turn-helix YgiT family protein